MTVAQRRTANPKFDHGFLSQLQKQFPNIVPPAIAIAIFLALWQLFSWTPGATLPANQGCTGYLDVDFVSFL